MLLFNPATYLACDNIEGSLALLRPPIIVPDKRIRTGEAGVPESKQANKLRKWSCAAATAGTERCLLLQQTDSFLQQTHDACEKRMLASSAPSSLFGA
jgi:hypothetical protein